MFKSFVDRSDFIAKKIFNKIYKETEAVTHQLENQPGVVKSILTKDTNSSSNREMMTLTVLLKDEAPVILTVSLIHQKPPKWMVKSLGSAVGKYTTEVKNRFYFLMNRVSNVPQLNTEMWGR